MNILAVYMMASPDLSGLGNVVLLTASLFPIFVMHAFFGGSITLGILQFLLLVIVELVQYRLIRTENSLIRLAGIAITYACVNLSFTLVVFFRVLAEKSFYLCLLGIWFPLAFATAFIWCVRTLSRR